MAAKHQRTSEKLSLHGRLLIAMSVALIAFMGLAGGSLLKAFVSSQLSAVEDSLQGQIYALLAAAEVDQQGNLTIKRLPESRFSEPFSGLYAQISSPHYRWFSSSTIGTAVSFPGDVPEGEVQFFLPGTQNQDLFTFAQGVVWELDEGKEYSVTFAVAQRTDRYDTQVSRFKKRLWTWLGGATILLLLVQYLILRWSLRPMRHLVSDVNRIEKGEVDHLAGQYPAELQALTRNLNALVESRRAQMSRYRKSLADLAHSLKTPLAILQGELENQPAESTREQMQQLQRMNDLVAYQLKRAAHQGAQTVSVGVEVSETLLPLVETLGKLFSKQKIDFQLELAPGLRFFGDSGDLQEVLGNLIENACKWCDSIVRITAHSDAEGRKAGRAGICFRVEDDGPGIDSKRVADMLLRGIRGDERVDGHGIGLSIVSEIVSAYGGSVAYQRTELGGACFEVVFPGSV